MCALFLSLHVCLCVHRTFTISTLDGGNPASGAVHSPYKQAVGMRAAQGLLANASGTVAALPFMPPQYSSSSAGPGGVVTIKLADAGLQHHRRHGGLRHPDLDLVWVKKAAVAS